MARTKKPQYTARTADRHVLYENSVQAPELDAAYIDRLFTRMRKRRGHLFREDFCGTAILSCEWVRRHREHRAIGVDLHVPTLNWARKHNLSTLSEDQHKRIRLLNKNVLHVTAPKVDIVAAMNFSYFIFKTRDELRKYFARVRKSLKPDGLFLLDAYGGSESLEELEERRRCSGFTYVWEHAKYNPVTAESLCHIHFDFRDGSRMRKAFTYDWRLWSLVELLEVLKEAGFGHSEVHWEGTDSKSGKGNGVYRKTTRGEAISSWVAYIVALV